MSVELNEVGDVMLDLAAMRVLGEGSRYLLLEQLRKSGPATAGELGAETGDLGALAGAGLVTGPDDEQRWNAVGRGLFLDIPSGQEGLAAARRLVGIMLLEGADTPQRWVEDVAPGLEAAWFSASGRLSVRVALTPQELDQIQAAFEKVLEPYVNRPAYSREDLRSVRILSYFLPAAN